MNQEYSGSGDPAKSLELLWRRRPQPTRGPKPALTVDLEGKEGAKETLLLYPPIAAGTPARAGGRDIVLLLPSDKLKEIQGKLDEVKNAKPLK